MTASETPAPSQPANSATSDAGLAQAPEHTPAPTAGSGVEAAAQAASETASETAAEAAAAPAAEAAAEPDAEDAAELAVGHLHELVFYYDPISPFAHLAFELLPEVLSGLSVVVRYRPVLFAALLKAHGQRGPAEVPGKRDWTYRHVSWLAQHHGVRLDLPAAHPFNPLPLLRMGLATATPEAPGDTNRYVTEQLFHHVWHGGADAAAPDRLDALRQRLQDHMAQRQRPWPDALWPDSEVIKQQLRRNTEEALARGLFGVPSLLAGGRMFWGVDALPMLRDALTGGRWFACDGWHAASRLPAGVQRPA